MPDSKHISVREFVRDNFMSLSDAKRAKVLSTLSDQDCRKMIGELFAEVVAEETTRLGPAGTGTQTGNLLKKKMDEVYEANPMLTDEEILEHATQQMIAEKLAAETSARRQDHD
jgi:hypothetical protein